jgi:hypothetical protein
LTPNNVEDIFIMTQYKETISPPFSILLQRYLLFFAIPCLLLLPIAVTELIKLFPHMPHYSGGLFHLYIRCYTGPFLFFVIPVLLFLALVSHANSIVRVVIKKDRLCLPVQTGVYNAGHKVTIIPLEDIVSFKAKKHNFHSSTESLEVKEKLNVIREYLIPCYKGYQGDWAVVEFSRPKKSIARLLASLGGDVNSYECEQIRIEFPSERFEEIKLAMGK